MSDEQSSDGEIKDQPLSLKQLCDQHNMELAFFCFTCSDLVCRECFQLHVHANDLHQIATLDEAKEVLCKRVKQVMELLVEKRRVVLQYLREIMDEQRRCEQLGSVISADIFLEMRGVQERIRENINKNTSSLNVEIVRFQKLLNLIDDIYKSFKDKQKDPSLFLLFFNQLHAAVQHIKLSPVPPPPGLPVLLDQLQQFRQVELSIKLNSEWNALLDELILKTLTKIKQRIKAFKQTEQQNYRMRIPPELKAIRKFQAICIFCGQFLAPRVMNQVCLGNGNYQPNKYGPISQQHLNKFKGTRKHFWGPSDIKVKRGSLPNLGRSLSKQEYYLSIVRIIRDVLLKIRFKLEREKKELSNLIPVSLGQVQFVYKLRKFLKEGSFDFQLLFTFMEKEGRLERQQLESMLRDPNRLVQIQQESIQSKFKGFAPKSKKKEELFAKR